MFQEVPVQHNTPQEKQKKKWGPLTNEKSYRNHLLTDAKKQENRQKYQIRVFGLMSKMALESRKIYTVGLARAKVKVCFQNLSYNISRLTILTRPMRKLRFCLSENGPNPPLIHSKEPT